MSENRDDYYTEAVEQWRKAREKAQRKARWRFFGIFVGHVVVIMALFYVFKGIFVPMFPEFVQYGVEWVYLGGLLVGGISSTVAGILYEIYGR